MLLHPTKCQYITVNTPDTDPFNFENIAISYTQSYTYLGAVIANTNIVKQVSEHMTTKRSHLRTFTSFVTKNSDAPYAVKAKVCNSALNAAILYSCETWLTGNLQCVESSYISSIKQSLSVRNSTCNDLVYLETGLPNAKSLICDRQIKFLRNIRDRHTGNYIVKTLDKAIAVKSPMGRRVLQLEANVTSYKETFSMT